MKRIHYLFLLTALIAIGSFTFISQTKSFRKWYLQDSSSKSVIEFHPPHGSLKHQSKSYKDINIPLTSSFLRKQVTCLTGDELVIQAITDYQLDTLYQTNRTKLKKEISERLSVSQVKGSDHLSIEIFFDSKEKSQQIAYALMTSYKASWKRQIDSVNKERLLNIKNKIRYQENKVTKLEEILNEYSKQDRFTEQDKLKYYYTKEDYHRESQILIRIKSHLEDTKKKNHNTPFNYQQKGWTEDIETAIADRKTTAK